MNILSSFIHPHVANLQVFFFLYNNESEDWYHKKLVHALYFLSLRKSYNSFVWRTDETNEISELK